MLRLARLLLLVLARLLLAASWYFAPIWGICTSSVRALFWGYLHQFGAIYVSY